MIRSEYSQFKNNNKQWLRVVIKWSQLHITVCWNLSHGTFRQFLFSLNKACFWQNQMFKVKIREASEQDWGLLDTVSKFDGGNLCPSPCVPPPWANGLNSPGT